MSVPSRRRSGNSDAKVTTLSLDFTNVQDGGGGAAAHVPEGDYILTLKEASVQDVKKDPSRKQIVWIFTIKKGPGKSSNVIYHRTALDPERLWTTRNLLAALLDKEIPKKSLNIDLAKYFGRDIGATLIDGEPYNGKVKSEISDVFPASQYDDSGLATADANEESDDEDAEATESDEDEEEIDIDEDDI